MALIETDLFGVVHDKVQTAINRLKAFCPNDGYYLAFSGGKDSVVLKALCDMAGVKYDAHYNATTVDPPELVRFILREYADVEISKPEKSMRALIIENKFPPTRKSRYCCRTLKETGGQGRVVLTGVRWAESFKRRDNQGLVTMFNASKARKTAREIGAQYKETTRGGIILNNDNDTSRLLVERCYLQNKTTVNPIIDWDDADVWEFIEKFSVKCCELYKEGWARLGCVGCPLGSARNMRRQFVRWPAIRKMYVSAFDDMLKERKAAGMELNRLWTDGEGVLLWWTSDAERIAKGQTEIGGIDIAENK